MEKNNNISWYNAIGKSIADEFRELPKWFQIILILFLSFVLFYWVAKSEINKSIEKSYEYKVLTSKQRQIRINNELDVRKEVNKVLDSIEKERKKYESSKNVIGKWNIKEKLLKVKAENPQILSISFVSLHNGGQELKPDNNWELDVIASSDKEIEKDFKDDEIYPNENERKKKLWDGLLYWSAHVKKNGIFFFEDIKNYEYLYVGKLKGYLNQRGVKATHGIFTANLGDNLFYVSIDYSNTNVDEVESAKLLREVNSFVKETLDF